MRNEDRSYIEIHGEILRRTDKAILIQTEDGEEHWVPDSVCLEIHSNPKVKGEDYLRVQCWFGKKLGF